MRVLICFDGTASSAAAVQMVVARGWPVDSVFKVLTVRQDSDLQKAALEPLQRRFGVDRVLAEQRVAGSSVGDTILHVAAQWQADLIAMGSRDRVGLTKLILGSVSDYVLKNAHCSVLVARHLNHYFLPNEGNNSALPLKILLCVDHYEDSLAAVNYLLTADWPDNTKFIIIKVMQHGVQDFKLGVTLPWLSVPYESDIPEGQAIVEAANVVGQVSMVLEERFPQCEIEELIQEGFPALRILSVARDFDVDLLVMGAGRHQNDARSHHHEIGPIARAVAEEAPCSVQIVRSLSLR